MATTPHSQCRGLGSTPDWGIKTTTKNLCVATKTHCSQIHTHTHARTYIHIFFLKERNQGRTWKWSYPIRDLCEPLRGHGPPWEKQYHVRHVPALWFLSSVISLSRRAYPCSNVILILRTGIKLRCDSEQANDLICKAGGDTAPTSREMEGPAGSKLSEWQPFLLSKSDYETTTSVVVDVQCILHDLQ